MNNIGIVSENSLSYVTAVFDAYMQKQVVVLLRSVDDKERIEQLGIESVIEPKSYFGWFDSAYKFNNTGMLAQISFTSGTEGEPKGVLLTHKMLSDVTKRLNDVMELDASICEYVGVPVNYSFGLGRFRAISAVGGRAFLPEFGFNPTEIRDMLLTGEINSISAVPTLWRVLLKMKSIFGHESLNLKWIEIGSQYMSRGEKEELKILFPNAIIVQHYGLTEASRTTFLRIDQETGERLESVGTGDGNTEIEISDSGCICIRGSHVASQLLKQGEYASNVDEFGWFATNDLGKIEDGYLYYQGRADDLINCAGIKLSPDALEQDLRGCLKIKEDIVVAAYDDDLVGSGVLVAKRINSAIDAKEIYFAMADILLTYGINNKSILKVMELDDFPTTQTGKVKRKELSVLYKSDQYKVVEFTSQPMDYKKPNNDFELSLSVVWQKLLKLEQVGVTGNFFDLGGDSLMTVLLVHEMELASGIKFDIGDIFSHPTIEQLVDFKQSGEQKASSSIVPLQEKGGGLPLFCVCGINIYQELADSLGASQPVYGIYVAEEQAFMNAVMAGEMSDLSVVHLAQLYCDAILRKQPEGPYQLAGISFGGLLAIEAARLLKEQGAEVSLVVLLDTILPSGIQRNVYSQFKKGLKGRLAKIKKCYKLSDNKEQQLAEMANLREKAYRQAMEAYSVAGDYYDGQVVLIKAKEQHWGAGVVLKDDYGWGDVVSSEIVVHEMAGDHLGIIKQPNVLQLAKQLKGYLQ